MEYLRLESGSDIPLYQLENPYKAIVVAETLVEPEWQSKVSRWLVDTGCLYMMAWGVNCSSWDDSVDVANIEAFNYKEIPGDKFVVTTWHSTEPLKEVFLFAKNSAKHPEVELANTLILHISSQDRGEEFRREYESA